MRGLRIGVIIVAVVIGILSGRSKSKRKVQAAQSENGIVRVDKDDPDMNKAMDTAKQTVQTFLDALKSPKPEQNGFSVKKRFTEGEGVEYMWLTDLTYDGKMLTGKLNNDPVTVKNVKFGQSVTIAPKEVSDWMYIEKDKLVGGYTIRVHYKRDTPANRKAFDEMSGFKIE